MARLPWCGPHGAFARAADRNELVEPSAPATVESPGGAGVVAEKGNELVNGVLVSGPATVTGRTQTADLLNKVVENSRSDSAINVTYAPVISVSMDGNAQQNGNSQALIQQMGKLIDDRTKASFTQFLIEQKRPGGLLSK